MSHFAKVENGIVANVIVAEQDVIDSGIFGHGWVQTSYNTHGGQHPEGRPLRKNYAGIGYTYDEQRDILLIMNSGHSIYLQFAGTTQKWCISDTEKLWKKRTQILHLFC